jgi:hypothetical protein
MKTKIDKESRVKPKNRTPKIDAHACVVTSNAADQEE